MLANVLFFLFGAGASKHDGNGFPAPMKPSLLKFVLTTDLTLFTAACAGSLAAAGSTARIALSLLFAAGCMIGAIEGVPAFVTAIKSLMGQDA